MKRLLLIALLSATTINCVPRFNVQPQRNTTSHNYMTYGVMACMVLYAFQSGQSIGSVMDKALKRIDQAFITIDRLNKAKYRAESQIAETRQQLRNFIK